MKKLNSIDNKYLILADQILVSITAVLTNIFIAKFIGLQAYGQFSSVILVQLFLLGITQAFFGSTYVVLYHNNNINEKAKYTSSLLVLLFIYLLLLSIPISIYLSFTKFELSQIFFIYSSVILFFIQDFLRRVLITQQKIKATILSDAITSFLQITFLLIFFYFKILNTTTIWLIIAVTFLPSIAYAILKLKPVKTDLQNINQTFQLHKKHSSWLAASAMVQWISGNAVVYMSGWWISMESLAALRIIQYLFGFVNVILQAYENYMLPYLAKNKITEIRLVVKLIINLMIYIIPLLIIVVVCSILFSEIIFNNAEVSFSSVIIGYSILYIIIASGYPVRILMRVNLLNNTLFYTNLVSACITITTAKFLLTQFALNGVIINLMIAQIIVISISYFKLKKTQETNSLKPYQHTIQ